jgi:signal transduction histidine kinase
VASGHFLIDALEAGLSTTLSLGVIAFGAWAGRRYEDSKRLVRVTAWGVGGGLAMFGVILWLFFLLWRRGEMVSEPLFIAVGAVTIGVVGGTATGYFHDAALHHAEELVTMRDRRIDRFSSVVSHDLRNPLNVAVGSLELARESGDGEHFERAERALERMDRRIEEVLALTRGETDVVDPQVVDLRRAVERAASTVELYDATVETTADVEVTADPDRLRTLLENLLRNAVEHGGRDVTVRVGGLDDDTGFFVEDDGVGIPEDDRDSVFEMGHTTTSQGTGLGLAVVRQVADAHGWTVRAAESGSGGARFEVMTGTATARSGDASRATGRRERPDAQG